MSIYFWYFSLKWFNSSAAVLFSRLNWQMRSGRVAWRWTVGMMKNSCSGEQIWHGAPWPHAGFRMWHMALTKNWVPNLMVYHVLSSIFFLLTSPSGGCIQFLDAPTNHPPATHLARRVSMTVPCAKVIRWYPKTGNVWRWLNDKTTVANTRINYVQTWPCDWLPSMHAHQCTPSGEDQIAPHCIAAWNLSI